MCKVLKEVYSLHIIASCGEICILVIYCSSDGAYTVMFLMRGCAHWIQPIEE